MITVYVNNLYWFIFFYFYLIFNSKRRNTKIMSYKYTLLKSSLAQALKALKLNTHWTAPHCIFPLFFQIYSTHILSTCPRQFKLGSGHSQVVLRSCWSLVIFSWVVMSNICPPLNQQIPYFMDIPGYHESQFKQNCTFY